MKKKKWFWDVNREYETATKVPLCVNDTDLIQNPGVTLLLVCGKTGRRAKTTDEKIHLIQSLSYTDSEFSLVAARIVDGRIAFEMVDPTVASKRFDSLPPNVG